MIIDNNKFYEYVSNINERDSFISFSQQIDENQYFTLLNKILAANTNLVYWNNPSQKYSFTALGEIFTIGKKNKNDHKDFHEILCKVKKNYYHNLNKINFNRIPLFIGAHKFPINEKTTLWKDFEYEKWFIPKYLLFRNGNFYSVIINYIKDYNHSKNYLDDINEYFELPELVYDKNSIQHNATRVFQDDSENWNSTIFNCLNRISKKELDKVVMARKVELESNSAVDFADVVNSLQENYPKCYTFIYRESGSTFFGATPEKLLSINKGIIETDALAGSIQRGESEISDNELGLQLLESEKDINEHNSVRNFLLEKLFHVSEEIEYDNTPQLRKLSNIQHLWTPIKARLKDDINILSLIENLYPTPAICGYPTDAALKLIYNFEEFDRGLYAGIIGWFNLDNEGEFAVALRSAMLKDGTINAFAGCGIVEGSNPILEYNETELKLKPILSLFIDETINQS